MLREASSSEMSRMFPKRRSHFFSPSFLRGPLAPPTSCLAHGAPSFPVCSPIKLVVAKCWDPNPKGYFTIPRTEPVRPIDPGAWVAHTEAARGAGGPPGPPSALAHSRLSLGQPPSLVLRGNSLMPFQGAPVLPGELRPPSVSTLTSTSSSVTSSVPESESECLLLLLLSLYGGASSLSGRSRNAYGVLA